MVDRIIQTGQAQSAEGAAIARHHFEGFDGIAGNASNKFIALIAQAALVTDRLYRCQLKWAAYQASSNEFKQEYLIDMARWTGAAWAEANTSVSSAASASFSPDANLIFERNNADGIRLQFSADKSGGPDNVYFWWEVDIVEIDQSAALLP